MSDHHYPILAAYSAVKTYLREPQAKKTALPIPLDRALTVEDRNFTRQDQWVMESATD